MTLTALTFWLVWFDENKPAATDTAAGPLVLGRRTRDRELGVVRVRHCIVEVVLVVAEHRD